MEFNCLITTGVLLECNSAAVWPVCQCTQRVGPFVFPIFLDTGCLYVYLAMDIAAAGYQAMQTQSISRYLMLLYFSLIVIVSMIFSGSCGHLTLVMVTHIMLCKPQVFSLLDLKCRQKYPISCH